MTDPAAPSRSSPTPDAGKITLTEHLPRAGSAIHRASMRSAATPAPTG
jgi:peptide subunit release factor RF-3